MAYMSQEHKARIRQELKKVMPKSWKWTLRVRHHSTIVLTIRKAPVDLLQMVRERMLANPESARFAESVKEYHQVNEYFLEREFSGATLEVFKKAKAALNLDNFDKSDIMTDYFHVGHYTDINVGEFGKPFQVG